MGCQKGACWSHCHYSPDRVTKPLKRVGERGEGKFEEVSWDEATTDIADAMLDAFEEHGPESVIIPLTPEVGAEPARIWGQFTGAPLTDGNAEFQDFSPGWHLTWGLFNPTASMDDWFLADLTLIWHANPVYTNIHWYHYLAESRYNGGEVVTIAPDYSPSAIHADYHQPIRIGTDAALALAMCKVIIDAGLYKKEFVQEQTDLPLLVRKDNGRFLRGSDVARRRAGGPVLLVGRRRRAPSSPPPRHTLAKTERRSGARGQLHRACSRTSAPSRSSRSSRKLRRHLEDYTPERAARDLRDPPGQHPQARPQGGHPQDEDLHRLELGQVLPRRPDGARHGAAPRAHRQLGQEGNRHALVGHHGDGRPDDDAREGGTGSGSGAEAHRRHDRECAACSRATDPSMTTEMVAEPPARDGHRERRAGRPIPPAFLWYYQYGYKERWNDPENNDPSMKRTFDEYVEEAIEKEWWGSGAYTKAYKDIEPRVLFEAGGNLLRRQRGGQKLQLLEHLWPKLTMIVSVDYRITTTGLYSDYILPAAQHYEKLGHAMTSVHHLNFVLTDKATPPAGDSLPDREIGLRILEAIERRAAERGMTEFKDWRGMEHPLTGLVDTGDARRRAPRPREVLRRDRRRQRRLRRAAQGDHPRDPAREGRGALRELGDGGARHLPGLDPQARRGAQPAALAHRGQDSLRHPRAARAVLHRPRVVPGGRRGAPDPQGAAAARRPEPPLPHDQRPQPLEHPLDEPDEQHHPEHPPRASPSSS